MKDQASATKNYYSHNFVRKCGHVSCSLGITFSNHKVAKP